MVLDLDKTRELMRERGIDCIIATSRENVYYSSGSDIGKPLRLAPVFIPLDSDPVFVVHTNEEVTARRFSWIKDIRVYKHAEWLPLSVWDFIVDVIKDKELGEGRIGLELLDVPGLCFDYIRKKLPSVEFVDCHNIFNLMRSVKTKEELKLMSEINLLTAKAITVAFEIARPGDTERSIARNMIDLIMDYGATRTFINLGAGEYTLELHHKPMDYKIKKGDMIHVDCGGWWKGYRSDIARMAVVGKPNDRQIKAHDVIVKAMWDTADAMLNGATVLDVHKTTKSSYESQGFRYPRVFIGHGAGIGGHEVPMLGEAHGDWVLKPGMFFQLEPSLPMGDFRVHTEDSFIVRKKGSAECVSQYVEITGPQVIR